MENLLKEININEIKGFKIGHAQNIDGATGCTAIICENGAFAGVDVRGGGPATRETDLLKSENMIQQIHAVMLSGGSAYGLDAASGAMAYLEEKNIGFNVGVGVVPIVCGASLFDLVVGDCKCRPDKTMGYEACVNAEKNTPEQGNVGAGTGASVGKFLGPDRMMKSGIGIYAVELGDIQCGAIVAVNALGDVFDFESGEKLAGILTEDKKSLDDTERLVYAEIASKRNVFSGNTTIGCVITNAKLSKAQLNKMASICHDGYARAIKPVHTSADGDSIFVMSTGEIEASPDGVSTLATYVVSKAIKNAVINAESAYGLKAAKDIR